jgi:hypothetical protein
MADEPLLPLEAAPPPGAEAPLWQFVDEAGDPTIFHDSGKVIADTPGCSRFFMLGKLEVDDPPALTNGLTLLRQELLADPYFAGVESFKPERKKTALLFHAKDDVPEVRYRVFDLLRRQGKGLRFHAVVCDKLALAKEEQRKREADARHLYRPDTLYDSLVRSLFGKFHRLAERYEVFVAKRGSKSRNQAFLAALEHAERDFEERFGFSRGGKDVWNITVSDPKRTVCLQAVDYFLWALQRTYEVRRHPQTGEEIREDRYLKLLWSQIAEVHDLHFGPSQGTFYGPQNTLGIEARFGKPTGKIKKPRI